MEHVPMTIRPAMRFFAATVLAMAVSGCATLGRPLPPPPTTAEIVQMAKDGHSTEEIIARMRESEAVYPLAASELAKLREQGVPDPVIDYMQNTYIEAERYHEYLRSRDYYWFYEGYGPSYFRPYYFHRQPFHYFW